MKLKHFFDARTSTLTYVVYDENSRSALCIDPVLDFDPASGKIWHESLEILESFLNQNKLRLEAILETHAHADHLSGAQSLKKNHPHAVLCIGEKITAVQKTFIKILNLDFVRDDGSQFDRLLKDNEELSFGSIKINVLSTPGHTSACCSYVIGDWVFCGDCIFMPDSGTGRADFPGGSAEQLYDSIQNKLYKLDDNKNLCVGHDYQPGGRDLQFSVTVAEQKNKNIQLKSSTSREDFLAFRKNRDLQLSAPKLLWPSIQVNIDAGRLPKPTSSGMSYLKWPLFLE